MAISLYDEAVCNLIFDRVKSQKIRCLRPSESKDLFSMTADQLKDNPITLPMISISRNNNIEILETVKQPLSFDGIKIQIGQEKDILCSRIPIKLEYQLDIWTKKQIDCENYVREFVFLLINNPMVKINVPYNGTEFPQSSHITLSNEIVDNSDSDNKLFKDQYTRMTLTFTIDDAYLYSMPIKRNSYIEEVQVEVIDNNVKENEPEIIYSLDN